MDRRALLGAAAVVAGLSLSGCLFGRAGGGLSFTLRLDPTDADGLAGAAALSADGFSDRQADLVAALTSNGTTTRYGRRPFEMDRLLVVDGGLYWLSVSAAAERERERPVLYAERVPASAVEGEAVEPAAFPRADHAALKFAVAAARRERGTADDDARTPIPGETAYVLDCDADATELLPTPEHEYITHGDDYYRLVVERRPVSLDGTEYALDPVDEATAASRVRADTTVYSFDQQALSADERELLDRAATGDGYDGVSPYSEAERSLLDRLGRDPEAGGGHTSFYLAYDDTWFDGSLSQSHGD